MQCLNGPALIDQMESLDFNDSASAQPLPENGRPIYDAAHERNSPRNGRRSWATWTSGLAETGIRACDAKMANTVG